MDDVSKEIGEPKIDEAESQDENPVKPKRKVNYVLTEKRAETLRKGREARKANIQKRNEEKKQKKEEEKQEKREIRAEVAEKVEQRLRRKTDGSSCDESQKKVAKKKESKKDSKKIKITVPESDSESSADESDYEIEIKKAPRRAKSCPIPEHRDVSSASATSQTPTQTYHQTTLPNVVFC